MNSPWECPRCGRMNAPFTPSCFCNKDYKSMLKDGSSTPFKAVNVCPICKGFHGLGRSCMTCENKEIDELLKKVSKPLYDFKQVEDYMKNSYCTVCGSNHGVFLGKAIQCAKL